MADPQWKELEFEGLRERLAEIKALLEQAMVLAAAQDARRLEAMTEMATRNANEQRDAFERGRGGR